MASQVALREKLLQFYLFNIASQEAVFEALLETMPKGSRYWDDEQRLTCGAGRRHRGVWTEVGWRAEVASCPLV